MNYEQSAKILEEIKKANKILINCHYKPDPDGIGSALALALEFKKIGNFEITLICPSFPPKALNFLEGFKEIKTVEYHNFDFSGYDLWVISDAANWWQVSGISDFEPPEICTLNIDHHETNEINLPDAIIQKGLSSTCELLYGLFEDWRLGIDKKIAEALLAGIIGDTGVFRYTNVTSKTLEIARKLMEAGADKNMITFRTYESIPFDEMKFWGKVLDTMQKDDSGNFVWTAINLADYEGYGRPTDAKSSAASNFAGVVDNTDFGVVMVEEKKNFLTISFRARGGFDVAKIAQELGGGGHKEAAGARILGMSFTEAVSKVLETCRKYAK